MELKQAFAQYLQTQLNSTWQTITLEDVNRIVVCTNYELDENGMTLLSDDGVPLIDNYGFYEKYIPCAILSFMGDRREIPNVLLIDAIIPVELYVDVNFLDETLATLRLLQDNLNGQIIKLKAEYQNTEDAEYSIVMSYDIPDSDEFRALNGINGKIISFQISATISIDLIYGNDIEYALSIDGGTTFTDLVKVSPNHTRGNDLYTDQRIGELECGSVPNTSVWGLNLSVLMNKNDNLLKLLYLTDMPYTYLGFASNPLDSLVLKTTYNFNPYLYMLPFNTTTIASGVTFAPNNSLHFLDFETFIDLTLYNSETGQSGSPHLVFDSTAGTISFDDINIYADGAFLASFSNATFSWNLDTMQLTNLSNNTYVFNACTNSAQITTYVEFYSLNYYIQDVSLESIGYVDELGDFIALSLSFKKKFTTLV